VRKQAKEAFLGIIRSEFKDENAIYHVNKLEAEIFSLFYYDLETYKEKAQDCANSLRDLFQKGTPLDCVMATSLDYTTIMNKSPILDYLSEDRLIDWNHYNLTSRDLEDVSQLRSDNLGQSASSEACDEITNPDLRPDMNLEDISSLADKLDKDSVSFEFLEELTKIKEEEIKKLKDILQNIQKENDLLKDALLEVRTHLIALESNEISLDKLSET
jgi:hypothetical protein